MEEAARLSGVVSQAVVAVLPCSHGSAGRVFSVLRLHPQIPRALACDHR